MRGMISSGKMRLGLRGIRLGELQVCMISMVGVVLAGFKTEGTNLKRKSQPDSNS